MHINLRQVTHQAFRVERTSLEEMHELSIYYGQDVPFLLSNVHEEGNCNEMVPPKYEMDTTRWRDLNRERPDFSEVILADEVYLSVYAVSPSLLVASRSN